MALTALDAENRHTRDEWSLILGLPDKDREAIRTMASAHRWTKLPPNACMPQDQWDALMAKTGFFTDNDVATSLGWQKNLTKEERDAMVDERDPERKPRNPIEAYLMKNI